MARVLVTEPLADTGLDALRAAGHEVDVRLGLSPDELHGAVRAVDALIVRSGTKVTAEVIAAATDLVVVGRAGIGIDNVDVDAATARGIVVVNAPESISVSNAEHTMALLLALARNVAQASDALRAGRWEKSRWEGVELQGKTLGLIGLGRVGTLVAQRGHAFGMRLIAWDRFVAPERARQMGVQLVDLDVLAAESDFVCVLLAKRPEYTGIVGRDFLAKAKPGLRVINTARGGLVDEDALNEALRAGQVAGAALDVFNDEPTTSSPLFDLDSVVVTPHLGASTVEAQDKAGVMIAEQVVLALAGDFVPFAINVEAAEASEVVRPFLRLAERLGRVFGGLCQGAPATLDIGYEGDLAGHDTRILTLSVLKGLFSASTDEPVSYVNAPQIAAERGVTYRESSTGAAQDFVNLISIRGGQHAVAGTLFGLRAEPMIVMLDDHPMRLPPADHLLVVRNDDRPGVIGRVGTALGNANVNIADMDVGRTGQTAVMVLATDSPVPAELVDELRAQPGVLDVHALTTS